jgi:diguanylate cyclase (GGDEF)-like protein
MISLRKSLNEFEESEKRSQAMLDCYLAAISSMEQHVIPVNEDLVYHHRIHLKALRRQIREDTSQRALDQSRVTLARELAAHCARSTAILEQKDVEVRNIIKMLAEAAVTLTTHNETHASRLLKFNRELEAISAIDDLREIRRRLAAQVYELKSCVETMRRDSEVSVEQLRNELRHFQQRLVQAEALAGTDPLTGVANRLEGEKKLEENIQSGRKFSILLFDLDRFKAINDRWGHQTGDAVLKIFARRLVENVRPHDTVCRWGGDEFLVILPGCGLRDAMGRAGEISERCDATYELSLRGHPLSVSVRASVGAAEHNPAEDSEALFRRADEFLYKEKGLVTAS